ncbi:MAG TPA: TonB-dependent receptor, partial [Steroidobacter sp.]|nr:TonB-dependent receptor [Steroidobacter sp.]
SDCSAEYTMPDLESFAPAEGTDRPDLLDFKGWAGSIATARRFEHFDLVAAYAQREQGNYYAGMNGPSPYIAVHEPLVLPWYTETAISLKGVSRFRAGERVPNTRYENRSTLLKGTFYLPAEQQLELGYLRYDSDFGEMMPSQIRSFGQAREWLPSTILMDTYTARYQYTPTGSPWFDLRANLWHTDSTNIINTPDIQSTSGEWSLEDNTRRDEDYKRWGFDLSNTMRIARWGGIKLTYGLAGQWEEMSSDTNATGGFYYGPRNGDRNEWSAFGGLEWTLPYHLTFDAGVRYTRFRSEDNNALPISKASKYCVDGDGDGECDPVFYRNRNSGWAPIAGLTWAPLNGLQFFVRYSEALRMPSLFETTSGLSVSPALDVEIKPEHAKNLETGINYLQDGLLREDDKLRIKLAWFWNHVDDYLTRTQPNAWEDQLWNFFRMRNIDKAEFHGVEISGSYDFGPFYAELGGTRYTHIEVCNIGSFVRYYCTNYGLAESYINNMIPPNWHASATLGVRLLDRKLDLGVRGTFMGKRNNIPRYNAQTGFNAPIPWHAYDLFDVYASWTQNDTITIDFNVDNVTDRYYLDALSLGLIPAPGRTARLSMTLHF